MTTRIAGLYGRYCVQGERAELARQLMASDARTAVVQVGALAPVPGAGANKVPTTIATGKPAPVAAKPKPAKAKPSAGGRQGQLNEIAERLGDRLDTRVTISLGQKKGAIVIDFATVGDLNRILAELGDEGFR